MHGGKLNDMWTNVCWWRSGEREREGEKGISMLIYLSQPLLYTLLYLVYSTSLLYYTSYLQWKGYDQWDGLGWGGKEIVQCGAG